MIENLIAESDDVEEEILSALDVPPGKMGRIIGRRGASIKLVKESCKYYSLLPSLKVWCSHNDFLDLKFFYCSAEIHIGGAKGPPDKVSPCCHIDSSGA